MTFESHIICDHCGYVDEEITEYPKVLQMDGDNGGWTCPACGIVHTVTLCVEYSFQTVPGYTREIEIGELS